MNALDLFCGCGGLSKGFTDAGLNMIAGIDQWDIAVNSYSKNFKHLSICQDLQNYPPEQFQQEYKINSIDIICGGFPCQGFSIAGTRDQNDPRNSLFREFIKYINYYHPKSFVMENVIGLLSMKTSTNVKVIDIIISLVSNDYHCEIFKLYASDYEVPQNRRRVFIIGFRKDLNIIPIEPTPVTKNNRPAVKNVLLNREQIPKSYFLSQKAIDGIIKRKEKMKIKNYGFGANFLDLDKPCKTISSRYWKDGYDALVKYNDITIRRLTELELKRIQTFPDDYILEGSKKDIIIQIGNAVPCRLAYHLGLYIKQTLSMCR